MCGVLGLWSSQPTADLPRRLAMGLMALQHRGQDGAGIVSYNGQFQICKNQGLVSQALPEQNLATQGCYMGVGHTRYATMGSGAAEELQPFLLNYPFGLAMAHNGNIVNTQELQSYLLKDRGRHLYSQSDGEVLLNLFADELASRTTSTGPDPLVIQQAVRSVLDRCQGGYAVVGLVAGLGLIAFRDPLGIRPLFVAQLTRPDGVREAGVASEAKTLEFLGFSEVQEVKPGQVWCFGQEVWSFQNKPQGSRPCMFEWVYFSSVDSVLSRLPVYQARYSLGQQLAETISCQLTDDELADIDVVCPVPDTARTAALGLADGLRKQFAEALIRNRYISRTFILESQDKREKAVHLKMSAVPWVVEGKHVLVVDDSIVRGTTSRKIIQLIRQAGARKITFASTCPPIKFPCYYGIDFPSAAELVAANLDLEGLARQLGADRVIFQTSKGLSHALQGSSVCQACLSGEYPVPIPDSFINQRALEKKERAMNG